MASVDERTLALPFARPPQDLDIVTVQRQPSMTRAIVLCVDLGGFDNDKDFCRHVDLDPSTWSQIKTGERCYPHDKFERLFDACGNEAPLIWLADRRGYVLTPKESEYERRLRLERENRERAEAENRLLKSLLVGRAV
jgi:hypothetical protein